MKTVVHMLATLTVIGVISGGALSFVNTWAVPHIVENQKRDTERAIFLVQPAAKSYEAVAGVKYELYRVFDAEKQPIGYAMPFAGNGFQGKIKIMAGVSPDASTVIGLEILDQVETPGLGTKVTEDPYRGQFTKLVAQPEIVAVKGAPPTKPNEVQTITGATISSKAVIMIVNDALRTLRTGLKEGAIK
jgi:electron transport complex protein RnfG